jgi:Tfp pilus assembly protein PilZ
MWDGVDRRKFPRAEYPCLVTVRKSVPSLQAILTHTENLSTGGVRVIISKKLAAPIKVDLELDLKDTLPTIKLQGKISWVKEVVARTKGRPPRYDTGIQFVNLKQENRKRIHHIVEHLLSKVR